MFSQVLKIKLLRVPGQCSDQLLSIQPDNMKKEQVNSYAVYKQEKAIILAGKWEQVSHSARKGEEAYVPL